MITNRGKSFLVLYCKELLSVIEMIKLNIEDIKKISAVTEIGNYLSSLQWDIKRFTFDEADSMASIFEKFEVTIKTILHVSNVNIYFYFRI